MKLPYLFFFVFHDIVKLIIFNRKIDIGIILYPGDISPFGRASLKISDNDFPFIVFFQVGEKIDFPIIYGKTIKTREVSVRSPLKVAIICLFRGIDVQVRIFRLNRAKKAFSAENFSCKCYFCYFHGLKRRGFMVQPVQPKFLLLMPE
jgi:hypothetical protein